MKRRDFLVAGAAASLGLAQQAKARAASSAPSARVVSTWAHGMPANAMAWAILSRGGSALDAAEKGVMIPEGDPKVMSVGFGGRPNAEGEVELDAAIMDGRTVDAGAVASMTGIKHPICVARQVLGETRHVLLVGEGARQFAIARGFQTQDLLSDEARAAWEKWKADPSRRVPGQVDDHDTIGMVTLDAHGHMAAACTTSGLAWKMPGRVGDSPLVGHGLYCDEEAGGASATGIGEEVIKVCGSYQVVEFMRQGRTPQEAVEAVLQRMVKRDARNGKRMMAFVAIRADGEIGFGSTIPGFRAAVTHDGRHGLVDAPSLVAG